MNAFDVLKAAYGDDIANHVCESYKEIEHHFALRRWKTAELDAGHFVEAVRRLLELQLTGTFTPFAAQISNFNDQALKYYEAQQGHESYRLLIPQAVKAIYSVRNKRGVGHIGEVSPNRMDSTYLLQTTKWILGEIVRLNSKSSLDETERLVTAIAERQIEGIWKDGNIKRVLNTGLQTSEQVLILLYDESPSTSETLRQFVEYRNATNFRQILNRLHVKRFIEVRSDGTCMILPPGVARAEALLAGKSSV
jgi:hypothetical protein